MDDRLFSFPNPVNEVAARVVAAGVVVMTLLAITLRQPWLIVPIAYGFVARALTGPKLSPLGLLATRVIVPRLPVAPRPVPGPPKRFAQTLGALVSLTALVLAFGFKRVTAAYVLLGMIAILATLESVFAVCVGCQIFNMLMRLGIIPEDVCAECADIWKNARDRAEASVPRS